jgi:hypothetical protein
MRISMLLFAALVGLCATSSAHDVPALGSKLPGFVLRASNGSRECETGAAHREPCTTVLVKGHPLTIAWDEQTKEITYLFTDDPKLAGDSELGIGGLCRLSGDAGRSDSPVFPFMRWLISPDWTESFLDWSGRAIWYAALRRSEENRAYSIIEGFVQSRYLSLSRK